MHLKVIKMEPNQNDQETSQEKNNDNQIDLMNLNMLEINASFESNCSKVDSQKFQSSLSEDRLGCEIKNVTDISRSTCVEEIDVLSQSFELNSSNIDSQQLKSTLSEEELGFDIKDVSDYSKATCVEEINRDNDAEGESLLRGWSRDQDDANDVIEGRVESKKEKALKALKKASVAVTGSALVVVGIPMIPMPTPGGVIVSGAGLAILATEFPAAQRVLDKGISGLERMVGKEEDDVDEENSDGDKNAQTSKGYASLNANQSDRSLLTKSGNNERSLRTKLSNDEYSQDDVSLMSGYSESSQQSLTAKQRMNGMMADAKKTGNRTKRHLKKFVRGTILPVMNKISTEKDGDSDLSSATNTKIVKDTPMKGHIGELDRRPIASPSKKNSNIVGFDRRPIVSPAKKNSNISGLDRRPIASPSNEKNITQHNSMEGHQLTDISLLSESKSASSFPLAIPDSDSVDLLI